jgi:hypothetical protein
MRMGTDSNKRLPFISEVHLNLPQNTPHIPKFGVIRVEGELPVSVRVKIPKSLCNIFI